VDGGGARKVTPVGNLRPTTNPVRISRDASRLRQGVRAPAGIPVASTVGRRYGTLQESVMLASPPEAVPAPLLARIIQAMRPEQIWLFGSRARGGARPTSDWDLLVVISDDATDDELDVMHAWQTVRDLRIPADVIPVRRSEFEEARDHAGTLVRTVVSEGMQVYSR
jgi:predicted nucleotidyltransferase